MGASLHDNHVPILYLTYYDRDLRKLGMNLIPFPRLHFLMPSYSPLIDLKSKAYQGTGTPELVQSCVMRNHV